MLDTSGAPQRLRRGRAVDALWARSGDGCHGGCLALSVRFHAGGTIGVPSTVRPASDRFRAPKPAHLPEDRVEDRDCPADRYGRLDGEVVERTLLRRRTGSAGRTGRGQPPA